jgi:hypothetical protein
MPFSLPLGAPAPLSLSLSRSLSAAATIIAKFLPFHTPPPPTPPPPPCRPKQPPTQETSHREHLPNISYITTAAALPRLPEKATIDAPLKFPFTAHSLCSFPILEAIGDAALSNLPHQQKAATPLQDSTRSGLSHKIAEVGFATPSLD